MVSQVSKDPEENNREEESQIIDFFLFHTSFSVFPAVPEPALFQAGLQLRDLPLPLPKI